MIIQSALILLGLVICATSEPAQPNPQLDEAWKKYKEEYEKKYEPSKEIERRMIWEDNLAEIEKHNAEAEKGLYSFQLGVNQFADLTKEEIGERPPYVLPRKDDLPHQENEDMSETHENVQLPPKWDWRDKGYVTSVKNQGICDSGFAFATAGTLEGHHKHKTQKLVTLSEQNILDCTWTYGNAGCWGGASENSLQYVVKNGGIDSEKAYPYTGKNSTECKYTKEGKAANCTSYKSISRNENVLATALVNHGPIAVDMCPSKLFKKYKSGIFEDPDCCLWGLRHSVLLVGYGSEKEKDYWIAKNSWGTKWGMEGYFRILRHKDECLFGARAVVPVG